LPHDTTVPGKKGCGLLLAVKTQRKAKGRQGASRERCCWHGLLALLAVKTKTQRKGKKRQRRAALALTMQSKVQTRALYGSAR
jgi:hypothetical protein